jgi:hypothetical protein
MKLSLRIFKWILTFRNNVITPTVITPTLITPTIITPILNTSTVTDSLCNFGAFSNPNAVRDCPFNLKGAWFLSRSQISEQWLKNSVKTCLQDQLYQTWHANIDTGSKTLNYRLFKNKFEFDIYFLSL